LLPSSPACKKLIRFYWISLISFQLPSESPWDVACKKKLIRVCRIRLISLLPSRNLLDGACKKLIRLWRIRISDCYHHLLPDAGAYSKLRL
jgi:hypothetical protein